MTRSKEVTSRQNHLYHQRHRDKILQRQREARATAKDSLDWRIRAGIKLWHQAKDRSRERGIDFNIEHSDVVIPEKCPVFKIPLVWGRGRRTASSPSLDRIDSHRGYVKGNVWVISWRANQIKSDATPKELRAVARATEIEMRSKRKAGGVIGLPYLDGRQHVDLPEVSK